MFRLVALLLTVPMLVSCDIYGILIQGDAVAIPDTTKLKKHLESYPEIREVDQFQLEGGRPVSLTGIKAADQTQYFNYSGQDVYGSIYFTKDYTGSIRYSHSLIERHSPPPQSTIDASWPVMQRIERDMEDIFGLTGHSERTSVEFIGVNPTKKKKQNKP